MVQALLRKDGSLLLACGIGRMARFGAICTAVYRWSDCAWLIMWDILVLFRSSLMKAELWDRVDIGISLFSD